jgi:hypothetical protein
MTFSIHSRPNPAKSTHHYYLSQSPSFQTHAIHLSGRIFLAPSLPSFHHRRYHYLIGSFPPCYPQTLLRITRPASPQLLVYVGAYHSLPHLQPCLHLPRTHWYRSCFCYSTTQRYQRLFRNPKQTNATRSCSRYLPFRPHCVTLPIPSFHLHYEHLPRSFLLPTTMLPCPYVAISYRHLLTSYQILPLSSSDPVRILLTTLVHIPT